MAAPASEDLRELERLLVVASDSGQEMSVADVQQAFGAPHETAVEMLGTLREHGKAVEVAPGEWRGPLASETPADLAEPHRLQVSVPEQPDPNEEAAGAPASGPMGWTGERVAQVIGEPTVRLTMPIARALSAESIGELVKAAIEGLEDGEWFVLEVTP